MNTAARVVRGLAALAVLVALLVGVPAGLWHYVGWPLPHAVPTWAQLRSGLTSQGIADETLIKVLAVVAWLAWSSVAASVWTEAAAAARGRVARRLPGLAPVQAFAGHLITAVVLIVMPLGRTSSPHPPPTLTLALQPAGSETTSVPIPAVYATAADAPAPPTAPPQPQPTYTVQRRDTLWGIAQQHLGDPLRWPEIYRLNENRSQPDGGALTNPNLIRPGWTLIMAAGPQAAEPTLPPPPEQHPAPPPLVAPATTAPPGTTAPLSPAAAPDDHPASPLPAASQPTSAERHDDGVTLPAGSLVGFGFAAGVAATLTTTRLRRRAAYRPEPPQPGSGVIEPDIGKAVAALQRAVPAARVEPEQRSTADLGRLIVGAEESTGFEVDLLAGALDLDGPGAGDTVRAMLADLLLNHRPDQVAVLLAGHDLGSSLFGVDVPLPAVEVAADLAAALARLEIEVIRRTRLLTEADTPDYRTYGDTHPEEPLPLLVAVHRSPADDTKPRLRAVESVAARLGICLIGLHTHNRERSIDVGSEGLVRSTQGIAIPTGLQLYHLKAADAAQITKLLTAHDAAPQPGELSRATVEAESKTWPSVEPSARVEVRLFGAEQLLVDGEEVRTGLRAKARELLAFLACRPDGATWEAAAEALWPEVDAQRGNDRFRTVVANLRTAGGKITDHDDGTVERVAEHYRLNPRAVTCDLWRFEEAVRRHHSATAEDERAQPLTDAVALYRGDLCADADYEWIEPLREDLRRRALDVIVTLAEANERIGKFEAAVEALEQAVTIDGYAEAVYQRLIGLYGRRGQPEAARSAYLRLERYLDEVGTDPSQETRAIARLAVAKDSARLSIVRSE